MYSGGKQQRSIFTPRRGARTGDGLGATATLLGEQLAEAVSAVGLVLTRRKLLSGQDLLTVRAHEAVAVERYALVRDSTLVDHLQMGQRDCRSNERPTTCW